MAAIGKFRQTSVERKRYIINYSDWLEDGETLLTVTFTSDPASPTPLQADAYAIDISGESVTCFMSGGVHGQQYKIHVRVTTSLGQTKEDEIVMLCKDF